MPRVAKVIVIEPDPVFNERLAMSLKKRGYSVASFCCVDTAQQILRDKQFDLVVGRVDGLCEKCFDGLEKIRSLQPEETLFVVMSDTLTNHNAIGAIWFGAADIFHEPFSPDDVAHSVESLLNRKVEGNMGKPLYRRLNREYRQFCFPTNEAAIGPAVDRLVENLTQIGLCSKTETSMVAAALTEALANAIYHGNLEISPRLKLELGNQRFEDEIGKRLNDPKYSNRRVFVEYAISQDEVRYVIRDNGPGFDYKKVMRQKTKEATDPEKPYGRGLYLLDAIMDDVKFNGRGNEIRLVKHASKSIQ